MGAAPLLRPVYERNRVYVRRHRWSRPRAN
jgi:hypothetical protein